MLIQPAATTIEVLFKALADRTRLRIVHLLLAGELCVCDLVAVLAAPQPTISRHLAYLRRAGWVRSRRAGQWSYYRLAPARGRLHKQLLACLQSCYLELPEAESDKLRLAHQRRSCCG